MKKESIVQMGETFFKVFGIILFCYVVMFSQPPYTGIHIGDRDCYIALAVSVLYTIMHSIITSETLDNKISITMRVMICVIPSVIMGSLLTVDFGLQQLLWWLPDMPKKYSLMRYHFLTIASVIIFFGIYWWTERRYIRIGKEYDKALAEYKKKMNSYELLELKENEENIK